MPAKVARDLVLLSVSGPLLSQLVIISVSQVRFAGHAQWFYSVLRFIVSASFWMSLRFAVAQKTLHDTSTEIVPASASVQPPVSLKS